MNTKITYKLGDLSNGDFESYDNEQDSFKALRASIDDGILENIQVIGEEGCPWKNEEEAKEAAEDFFYVRKHTQEFDEDGDLYWEDYEVIAGNIQ